MLKKIVIIGAGGFAREVLDVFDACNQHKEQFKLLGFVVEPGYGEIGARVNGLPILGGMDWFVGQGKDVMAICGIGAPEIRYRFVAEAMKRNVRFCSVIHPNAIVTKWVTMGEGVIITAGCIVTNNIRIGNHVQLNLCSTVGHDTVIGGFSTIAPGAHVSGNVNIGDGCYIGTGANILERINVGEWAVVGAGCAVVKNVEANNTVVGVPGKSIKVRSAGWHLEQQTLG